jgi:predicted CopG family antitoxin
VGHIDVFLFYEGIFMTTTQIEIRTDVYTFLQKIAEEQQTSVSDLIADMTEQLKDNLDYDEDEGEFVYASPEEVAALQKAVEEADAPGAKWYTREDVEASLQRFLYGDGKWNDEDEGDNGDYSLPTLEDIYEERVKK